MPKPRKLALNFRGTLPGGAGDQYTLRAELTWLGQRLSTNTIQVPSWQNSFQVGIAGTAPSSLGVFVLSKQFAPQGEVRQVLDKRRLRVVFHANVLKGNLSAQAIEQAAYNNLTLELLSLEAIDTRIQPRAAFLQQVAAGRKTQNQRTLEARLPSWSNYISPKRPGE